MNMLDYLQWRGDLSLAAAHFQEVDALILSRVSYLPMDGVLTEDWDAGKTMAQAVQELTATQGYHLLWPDDGPMMQLAAQSERFGGMRLCGYVNVLDTDQEKQFSAVTIRLNDQDIFVSFRGTDNTLVGWKEDFNMSFMETVPGQRQAAEYLRRAALCASGRIYVGGHSKGGNLAVYSAAFCGEDLQDRIVQVYNMDGPGFAQSIVQKPEYQRICKRILTYIPQNSVVGMLLEHEEPRQVIHSTETGLQQHNVYSWEVLRDHLIPAQGVEKSSEFIDRSLKSWLQAMDEEKRGRIIDAAFEILSAPEKTTMSEISADWMQSGVAMLRSWQQLDSEEQRNMLASVKTLVKAFWENMDMLQNRGEKSEKETAVLGKENT